MRMISGYCYVYSPEDELDIEIYTPDGGEVFWRETTIDGARMAVFKCADGCCRAQLLLMCEVAP